MPDEWPTPRVTYRRCQDYSKIASLSPIEENGGGRTNVEINLSDYWDYLNGIAHEAIEAKKRKIRPPLRRLSVFITDLCNLNCDYCKIDRSEARTMDMRWLLSSLPVARSMGAIFLDVMGLGEPTLVPGLPEILQQASSLGFVVTIGTNAATANLSRPDYLARLLSASPIKLRVSLDSAKPEVHDRSRRRHDTWHKAIRFIEKVIRERERGRLQAGLFINKVVNTNNLTETARDVDFFAELGVDDVHLIPIRWVESEYCSPDQIRYFNAEIAPQVEEIAFRKRLAWAKKNAYIFGRTREEISMASRGIYYQPQTAKECYSLQAQLLVDACVHPYTCLWSKRNGGRSLQRETGDTTDLEHLWEKLGRIPYLDVNPHICQNLCTREIIHANNEVENALSTTR